MELIHANVQLTSWVNSVTKASYTSCLPAFQVYILLGQITWPWAICWCTFRPSMATQHIATQQKASNHLCTASCLYISNWFSSNIKPTQKRNLHKAMWLGWGSVYTSCSMLTLPILVHTHFLAAVCDFPCLNGGRCTAPNTCLCDETYQGSNCSESKHSMLNWSVPIYVAFSLSTLIPAPSELSWALNEGNGEWQEWSSPPTDTVAFITHVWVDIIAPRFA